MVLDARESSSEQLTCVDLALLSSPYLGHLVEAAAGLGGFLGPGPLWITLTLPQLSLCPQGIPKGVAVSLLGMTC